YLVAISQGFHSFPCDRHTPLRDTDNVSKRSHLRRDESDVVSVHRHDVDHFQTLLPVHRRFTPPALRQPRSDGGSGGSAGPSGGCQQETGGGAARKAVHGSSATS